MKKDSTSTGAIAGLTMVLLPVTFIAVSTFLRDVCFMLMQQQSVLSAGIFESIPSMKSFEVTGLWWLWMVTAVPVTIITVACWSCYKGYTLKHMRPGVSFHVKKDSIPTCPIAERPSNILASL
jgi:hypothetical protein